MFLIGQYDSPFVRRVAIALRLYGLPFEHRPWSTFGDADKIAPYNPLRRVPTLVLDSGEALIESTAILDYLDELVGPDKAMIAPRGARRRSAACSRCWKRSARPLLRPTGSASASATPISRSPVYCVSPAKHIRGFSMRAIRRYRPMPRVARRYRRLRSSCSRWRRRAGIDHSRSALGTEQDRAS